MTILLKEVAVFHSFFLFLIQRNRQKVSNEDTSLVSKETLSKK